MAENGVHVLYTSHYGPFHNVDSGGKVMMGHSGDLRK